MQSKKSAHEEKLMEVETCIKGMAEENEQLQSRIKQLNADVQKEIDQKNIFSKQVSWGSPFRDLIAVDNFQLGTFLMISILHNFWRYNNEKFLDGQYFQKFVFFMSLRNYN